MTSIKPRVLPRDALDILILLFVISPFQLFPLFGVPFLVGTWVTGSIEVGFLMIVAVYVLFLLFSVWSLQVTQEGIKFRRLLGSPKFVPWTKMSSIRAASRTEVIIRGWLWPLFPAREMTACLSARGHVRFEGPFGVRFFPPKDTEGFLKIVSEIHFGNSPNKALNPDAAKSAAPVS